jgi:hypothetical protein
MSINLHDIVKTTKPITISMPNGESFELPVDSIGGVVKISDGVARVEFEVHLLRSAAARHVMSGRAFFSEPIALEKLELVTPTKVRSR